MYAVKSPFGKSLAIIGIADAHALRVEAKASQDLFIACHTMKKKSSDTTHEGIMNYLYRVCVY